MPRPANLDNFSRYCLEQEIRHPAVSWRWIVRMPKLSSADISTEMIDGTGLSRVYNDTANKQNPGAQPVYKQINAIRESRVYVEAVSIPNLSINAESRNYSATTYKYPGATNYNSVNITFYEDHRFSTLNMLTLWQFLVFQPNNTYGMPYASNRSWPSYKKQIQYYAYDTFGGNFGPVPNITPEDAKHRRRTTPVLAVLLNGAWPTQIGQLDCDYEKNGRVQIQAEFAIDSVGMVFYKPPWVYK